MIRPFIHGEPSHLSHPSRSGVKLACEGFCDGLGNDNKPSRYS